jgi:NADH-quinone oxidoreductase subunit N
VIILLSVAAVLSGLMLKAALPPFHKWNRELHENSPISIVAFLAVAFAAAVLAAFAKIFINGLFAFYGPEMNPNDWGRLVSLVAFAAMVFGTAQLTRQKEMVSLLYYSNIAQMGFILTGLVSMNQYGLQSAAFCLFAFMAAVSGIYAMILLVKNAGGSTQLTELRGLYHSNKFVGIMLAISLMSLAGLPLTAGFVAKLSVIQAAISMATIDRLYHWMYLLAAAGTICAVIAFFKFVRIVWSIFTRTSVSLTLTRIPWPALILISVMALTTVFFGVLPDSLLDYAAKISLAFGFMAE